MEADVWPSRTRLEGLHISILAHGPQGWNTQGVVWEVWNERCGVRGVDLENTHVRAFPNEGGKERQIGLTAHTCVPDRPHLRAYRPHLRAYCPHLRTGPPTPACLPPTPACRTAHTCMPDRPHLRA
eukprot:366452-Chlamydomonas_euryale.AAC.3